MSKNLVQFDIEGDATQAKAMLDFGSTGNKEALEAIVNMAQAIAGGALNAAVNLKVGCDYASITGTFSGNPSNTNTVTIAGQTIESVTSGAGANQFDIASGAPANAAAMVAAINASTVLNKWVIASADGAVVTIRALVPGVLGNAITLADNMNNFAWAGSATRLAGGDQDTNYTYVCGRVAETT